MKYIFSCCNRTNEGIYTSLSLKMTSFMTGVYDAIIPAYASES
nr:MAG TPA: hypothetical protein [Caudoviricetes sp.]